MDRELFRPLRILPLIITLVFVACQKKSGDETADESLGPAIHSIDVSWAANRDKDVNAAGGGYRVYYSRGVPADPATAASVDVPYISGATAPTTVNIPSLPAGTYFVRVVAYAAFNPLSVTGGNHSAGSAEISVTIP